ncbi:MAG: hypothetical protein ABR556_07865 [Pyrinomonadaceae bacterium]
MLRTLELATLGIAPKVLVSPEGQSPSAHQAAQPKRLRGWPPQGLVGSACRLLSAVCCLLFAKKLLR